MALSATRLKDGIKAKIEAISNFPAAGQSPIVTDDRVLLALAQAIIEEIQGHADIVLASADISINPGTFIDSVTSAPITGQGVNAAVTLEQKVQ